MGHATLVLVIASVGGAYWALRMLGPSTPIPTVGRMNGDLFNIYYPTFAYAYRGPTFLPRWNPYQLAGTPFLANYNGGFLYPPNWIATVVPVHRALGYLVAFHLVLAGVSTGYVARRLGLSMPAAMLAALGFMLNGFLVAEQIHPSYLAGLSWIPLVALASARLVLDPGLRSSALLGLVVALQLLTGMGQIVCYEAWVLPLVAAAFLATRARVTDLPRLLRAGAGAAVIAALLAAAQLLPTLEVVRHAVRGFGGLTLAQTMPQQPTAMFARFVAGNDGVVLLLLVPFAVSARTAGRSLVAIAVAVVAFTWAVGMGTPLYARFFYHLPGVNLFRLPHQVLQIGAFGVALLAGVGLDALASATWRERLVGVALSLALALVIIGTWIPPAAVLRYPVAVAACAIVLGCLPVRVRGPASWAVLGLAVMEVFARPASTLPIPFTAPPGFFAKPAAVAFLEQQAGFGRILTVKNWSQRFPVMEKLGTLWGLGVVQDYEPLAPAAYQEFLRPLERMNVDAPLFWGRFTAPPTDDGWAPLDLLGVRWVVVARGASWAPRAAGRFVSAFRDAETTIYENTRALPRAFLVDTARVVSDDAEALRALRAREFDPRATVLLDREPVWPSEAAGEAAPAATVDQAHIDVLEPDEVRLTVATSHRAILVSTDLHWPGWTAYVDGVETPILRADFLFRGVALPPGSHQVRFRYAPRVLLLGEVLSLATLTTLAGGWLWTLRRSTSATAPERV